jgi:hypothetical protein
MQSEKLIERLENLEGQIELRRNEAVRDQRTADDLICMFQRGREQAYSECLALLRSLPKEKP